MKKIISISLMLVFVLLLVPSALALKVNDTLYATEPVNMRSGPGTQYDIITELQTGQGVVYLGKSGSWTKLRLGEQIGYVFSKYLSEERLIPGTLLEAKSNVNVRSGPGTFYSLAGKLAKGATITYLGIDGKWYRVEIDGQIAYVYRSYFKLKRFNGNEIAVRLWNSEYFDYNADIFVGSYTDNNNRLYIRVSRNADVGKVTSDLAGILNNDKDFVVLKSQMPVYANSAYLRKLCSDIGEKLSTLTKEQRLQCQVVSSNYSAESDMIEVGIAALDEKKSELFRKWIIDLPYIMFFEEDIIVPMM